MDMAQALAEAMSTTFENMAFLDAEPVPAVPGKPGSGQIVAIEFLRPVNGWLLLHLSAVTKQMVIENIHGVEWKSLTGAKVDDCLMEIVNVLAGNFLIRLGVREHQRALSLPAVLYDITDIEFDGEPQEYYFTVQDEVTKVSLVVSPAYSHAAG